MKVSPTAFIAATMVSSNEAAFVPRLAKRQFSSARFASSEISKNAVSIQKPTGTSFLPKETVERAKSGSPIEKAKLEKDPIDAWVDVYEYARKIREGEMTWEEVEKADLDTVR